MHQLITLDEAASRLGIHIATLRGWVRAGHVPAYCRGARFTRIDWDQLLEALSANNGAPRGPRRAIAEEASGAL
jgi:excisionase family DNA binding protein